MSDLYFGDALLIEDDEPAKPVNDMVNEQPFEEIDGCRYYDELVQGSYEWLKIRLGIMTASEMKLFFTAKLARAANEKARAHVYELLGQRVSGFIEEGFIGDHMLRGHEDEIRAGMLYEKHYAPIRHVGFCYTERFGFPFGFSPDALVGDDGLIETKSRLPKFQVQAILNHMADPDPEEIIPSEFMIQVQSGLLVTGRKWCDWLSYCGGLPMIRIRVFPDPALQEAIIEVGQSIEETLKKNLIKYQDAIRDNPNAIPTERVVEQQMIV